MSRKGEKDYDRTNKHPTGDSNGWNKGTRYVPSYEYACDICDRVPTVCIMEDGIVTEHMGLCGPCCFGTAEALDAEEWN